MSGHDCDEALTSLYQYLDKELEAPSATKIRQHLEECNGCLNRFDFETRLKLVVRERLFEDVPEELIVRLKKALAEERATS